MDGTKFENWMEETVFKVLPHNDFIVMVNMSYHTKLTDESKRATTAIKTGCGPKVYCSIQKKICILFFNNIKHSK